ncbi:TBC1 domain family member 5 [Metarhizium anisopliae]|nr:TBC1 domain family member 5 [Metarhizium anisopliae]
MSSNYEIRPRDSVRQQGAQRSGTFLLSTKGRITSLADALEEGRKDYQERRDHFLKFIRHPEALTELTVDPLADDPDDEIIRTEIQQDVQRLPDEVNYHEDAIQGMILDILFIYCKVNPDRGGYRQGMHELLAPIVYALEQDSIDSEACGNDARLDAKMLHVLDSAFIEHDAYILFSKLMEQAQSFYEVANGSTPSNHDSQPVIMQEQLSAIVERSRFIHEICLQKVDPELAAHLTNIEILPQIFLM